MKVELSDSDIRTVYKTIIEAEDWGKDIINNWSDPINYPKRLENAQRILGGLSKFTPRFDGLIRDTNELSPNDYYKLSGIWVWEKLSIITDMGERFLKIK